MQRYLAGDRAAGEVLVTKFTPLLRAIARRILGPDGREVEDDACQAAFLKLFARLDTWQARCPFCDWLAVVAARRILDFAEACQTVPPTAPLPLDVPDTRPPLSPEVVECLEHTLGRLPPDWRRAYELAAAGEDRESIARTLGKSVRTIQYWLAAIRDEIRGCLEP